MAEPVIGGALVAVLQDFVGFVDFLEADFARGIARILVRMPFHRKLAEGSLEPGLVRGAFDFKGFVVAALGGHPSDPLEVRLHSEAISFRSRFFQKSCASKDAAPGLIKMTPIRQDAAFALLGMRVMFTAV